MSGITNEGGVPGWIPVGSFGVLGSAVQNNWTNPLKQIYSDATNINLTGPRTVNPQSTSGDPRANGNSFFDINSPSALPNSYITGGSNYNINDIPTWVYFVVGAVVLFFMGRYFFK